MSSACNNDIESFVKNYSVNVAVPISFRHVANAGGSMVAEKDVGHVTTPLMVPHVVPSRVILLVAVSVNVATYV